MSDCRYVVAIGWGGDYVEYVARAAVPGLGGLHDCLGGRRGAAELTAAEAVTWVAWLSGRFDRLRRFGTFRRPQVWVEASP